MLLIALFAKNTQLKHHCSKCQSKEQKVADKGDNMGPASEKEVGNHCKSAGEKGVEIGGRRLEKEHGECAKSYQCKVQINLLGAGAHARACNSERYEGAEDDECHKCEKYAFAQSVDSEKVCNLESAIAECKEVLV